jgi:hypothetical protein
MTAIRIGAQLISGRGIGTAGRRDWPCLFPAKLILDYPKTVPRGRRPPGRVGGLFVNDDNIKVVADIDIVGSYRWRSIRSCSKNLLELRSRELLFWLS